MEQRSEEWFEARKGRITGSRVGAILGDSPYDDAEKTLRSMVRSSLDGENEFTGNPATEWGTYNEPGAIFEFELETGLKVEPCGFFEHEDWLGASPDGLIGDDALLEVKCPFRLRDKGEHKSISEQPHYYGQMQVQMFGTGRHKTYFWQWAPHDTLLEVVEYNQKWIDENLPILKVAHENYLEAMANPQEHVEPLRKEITTNRAFHIVAEYDELSEAIERATERKAELLKEMAEMADGKNALIAGRKLTLVERAGSVSYKKALDELQPNADLEKWRGKPSSSWKFT